MFLYIDVVRKKFTANVTLSKTPSGVANDEAKIMDDVALQVNLNFFSNI